MLFNGHQALMNVYLISALTVFFVKARTYGIDVEGCIFNGFHHTKSSVIFTRKMLVH